MQKNKDLKLIFLFEQVMYEWMPPIGIDISRSVVLKIALKNTT